MNKNTKLIDKKSEGKSSYSSSSMKSGRQVV